MESVSGVCSQAATRAASAVAVTDSDQSRLQSQSQTATRAACSRSLDCQEALLANLCGVSVCRAGIELRAAVVKSDSGWRLAAQLLFSEFLPLLCNPFSAVFAH